MKQSYLMIFEMGRAQSVKKKGNFYLNVYQSLAMLFIEKKKQKMFVLPYYTNVQLYTSLWTFRFFMFFML